MADISKIKLPDGTTYDVKDDTKVSKDGDTMSGGLITKYVDLTYNGRLVASYSTSGIKYFDNNFSTIVDISSDGDIDVVRDISCGRTVYSNSVTCNSISANSMSVTDISSQYTITKSSGNWVLNSFSAYRTGNVIQLQLNFRGNGTAVSGGTTVFQGTITAGPVPVLMSSGMRASTNHNGIVAINTNGAITVSTSGDNWNLSTSSNFAIPIVFITP